MISILSIVLMGGMFVSCSAQDEKSNIAENVNPDSSASQQGMRVYIDPVTGKPTSPPEGSEKALPANGNRLNTSSQGLVEVPSQVQGGGTVIDLQGRFQSSTSAIVGEDGKLTIEHHGPENSDNLTAPRGE